MPRMRLVPVVSGISNERAVVFLSEKSFLRQSNFAAALKEPGASEEDVLYELLCASGHNSDEDASNDRCSVSRF